MSDTVKYVLPYIADVLECDDDDALRGEIMQCVETVRRVRKEAVRLKINPIAIRKAARKAAKALDALNKVFPVRYDDGTVRWRIELLMTRRAPDGKYIHVRRFDVVHWECACQAYRLIKKYGLEPVQGRDGNTHRLTKNLVEIVTGGTQASGKDWLVKVVRRVHRQLNPPPPPGEPVSGAEVKETIARAKREKTGTVETDETKNASAADDPAASAETRKALYAAGEGEQHAADDDHVGNADKDHDVGNADKDHDVGNADKDHDVGNNDPADAGSDHVEGDGRAEDDPTPAPTEPAPDPATVAATAVNQLIPDQLQNFLDQLSPEHKVAFEQKFKGARTNTRVWT